MTGIDITPAPETTAGWRSPLWTVVLSILAVFSIVAITTLMLLDMRAQVEARARETSENLLQAIGRDIGRNIEVLDLSLKAVVDGMSRPDIMHLDPDLRGLVLFDRSATATGLGAMVVFDENGVLTIDAAGPVPRSIKPVADRDYFQAQRDRDVGLYLSRPYRSRLLDRDVIGLSRRISKPDGTFGGVALATVETRFLTALISSPKLGAGSIVSLVRDDGTMIARRGISAPARSIAGSANFRRIMSSPSGSFVGTSAIDGVERLYTYRHLDNVPMVLTVGLSTDEIYAEWVGKVIWIATLLCAALAMILTLTLMLARQLGRRATVEKALVAANAELAQLSITDALTGLGNRRRFDEILAREVRRAHRSGAPLALVLLDVDHFKRLNDRYGHQQGDTTLQAIARVLSESCEDAGGIPFRVGGEEFGAILPAIGKAAALAFAEEVRTRIIALGRVNPGSPTGLVTASFGVAEIGDDDPAVAYGRADASLYEAKRAGRNRVAAIAPLPAAA